MKSVKYIVLAFLVSALFSCEEKLVENNNLSEVEKDLVIDEALQSAIMDELLSDIDVYSNLGEGWTKSAEMEGGCPAVTIERPGSAPFWPRTITLDFGDGCDKGGKTISGIMVIEKTGPWTETGSIRKITFDGYTVDGVVFSGEKSIKNITETEGKPTFEIKADVNLHYVKITENETGEKNEVEVLVKREDDKTQVWLNGFGQRDAVKEISISGESKIKKEVGDVSKKIDKKFNDILLVQGCRFPQAGITGFEVKTFDDLKLEFALDYNSTGQASDKCKENCDCIATLISAEGSEDIDLSARWWKKARETKKDNDK